MQHDRTSSQDPARLELKRCSACAEVKRAEDFYVSHGRLSSYCKDCQRRASRLAYRRRRQDPDQHARMRAVDRLRKRRDALAWPSSTRTGSGGPVRSGGLRSGG